MLRCRRPPEIDPLAAEVAGSATPHRHRGHGRLTFTAWPTHTAGPLIEKEPNILTFEDLPD
jgi:hypothetical protein